jgi:hypothetical protein
VGAAPGGNIRQGARATHLVVLFWGAVTFSFGCAQSNPTHTAAAKSENFYSVATKSTGFYSYDPHQEVGPDKILAHDTVVVLLRPSFGYSVVRLMTGEQGYVSSKDLRVAPPTLIPKAAPTPRPSGPAVEVYSPQPPPASAPMPASSFEPSPLPSPR